MDLVLIRILILVFAVVVHETAHGWAALRMGDDTARRMGRLTLNPIPHIDLMGSIIIPGVMALSGHAPIGWAKPVPVDPRRLNDPWNDHPKIAAAGPLSNLTLALGFAVLLGLVLAWARASGAGHDEGAGSTLQVFLFRLFHTGVQINVILAMFNMLPMPPLDGSWILRRFLPEHLIRPYDNLRRYSMLLFIGLVVALRYTVVGDFVWGAMAAVIGRFEALSLTIERMLS